MTPQVSVVIPSRNERFLQKTVDDLLAKARGDIEIIVVLDGYWPIPPLKTDDRVIMLHRGTDLGMRNGINSAIAIAKGKYILKTDAHCMFGEGYDTILAKDCKENWVVVPRRKRLEPESWTLADTHKPDIDYMYLSFFNNEGDFGGGGLHGRPWDAKNRDPKLKEIMIDDLMTSQGSCWFMRKDYYYQLELLDEEHYQRFPHEFQEIGLKCWLSGGEVKVNKNTWYAHLHKGKKYGRGYFIDIRELSRSTAYCNKWITNSAWDKQTKPLSWLIEKFWPVPEWPEDRKLWEIPPIPKT